ncbi:MAG: DNA mismatch repair endonuclease MutL [Pirellulales bacterium]
MPDIQPLSASVVNKIAAGEVIERPASVLKELLENALDAGGRRIDVSIEKGGSELIRVRDDGCGICAEQLPLAVASHATSKIRTADDLFAVCSLGFRGEALASIAEVSRLNLRSRTADAQAGAELEVVGGRSSEVAPCGCPGGTAIEVRQLFFNTPVRRKFLRSPQTEMSHLVEAFTRLALAHCNVHFTLQHNGRTLYDLPAAGSRRQRVAALLGEDLAGSLIEVESVDEDYRLAGLVAEPTQSRANNRMQYVFVNGRVIRDRALQHALQEAYRGLLLTGRYPICFLELTIPADAVDVNVHPAKQEVRFQDGGRLYSQLLSTLRRKFLTTDLTARYQPDRTDGAPAAAAPAMATSADSLAAQSELVAWAKGQLSEKLSAAPTPGADQAFFPDAQPAAAEEADQPLSLTRLDRPAGAELTGFFSGEAGDASGGSRTTALQIHNRYLVTESDDGVVVIDQHALHERILYEQIRAKVLAGSLETQQLLVPEPVDMSASEAAAVFEQSELLAKLGIHVQPFGGETVLVSSYPAMLANMAPGEILRDLVEDLLAGGKRPDRRDLLDHLLHTIACKAAIKAGDRLTCEEISELLAQRHLAQDSHHCPHGRPTALVFTREQLDRQFKRI